MASPDDDDGLDLRHYLGVFRRRWWIIAACVGITSATALAASVLQTQVYEASSTLVIQERTSDTLFDPTTGQANDPQRAVATEVEVIERLPVRAAVQKALGRDVPEVSASSVTDTNVIELTVRSTDPALAARAADAYAEAYIEGKRTQAVDDVLGAATQVQDKIAQLQQQLDALPAASVQRDGLEQQIALFQQQLDQLQVGASLKTGGAQLVAEAEVPTSPVEPTPLRNTALAALVGLLLGIGIAFLVDHFDDRIRSKEDFEEVASGATVHGLIPSMPGWRKAAEEHLATVEMSASPIAEAYRSLRTSIQFMAIENPIKVLQITSAVPGEGKTTTAANLAVMFARAGVRTVLIDCDLRRPRLHRFFGLPTRAGLTDLLVGNAQLEDVISPVEADKQLWVIGAGARTSNPSELLATSVFQRKLETVRQSADFVILDSPPILPVTDGLVIANRVDATILVATADQTTSRNLRRTIELLRQVGAPLVGAILNRVGQQEQYGYSRYGGYDGARQERTGTGNGALRQGVSSSARRR